MLYGCAKPEPLTMNRMPYNGNEIKIDGYYYVINSEGLTPIYLYRNGVIFLPGGSILSNFVDYEKSIPNIKNNNYHKTPYSWGIFEVTNNEIIIERWFIGSGINYPSRVLKGEILNDTTFIIAGLTEGNSNLSKFLFRQFSPKPDSTNNFIK
jgi:hypothetical protein